MNGTTRVTHAMLLAAGLGTRMRPLTDDRPKPLIRAGGKTLLDHNLDQLVEAGIETVIVNVHYLAEQIEAHCAARAAPKILISDERAARLDSGGGVRKALPMLGKAPFFCLNADTIWLNGPRSNLLRMMEHFDPERMDILLMVAPTVTTIGWGNRGDFRLLQDGRLERAGRHEVVPFAYCGVAILKPALLADRPEVFSLNRLFDEAQEAGRLYGMRLDGLFMHVGTPDALVQAEAALRLGVF
ncbi:MAG: nucleotidyltransferase family protein [Methylobacterium sp.]|nr:nucleotidyltransferase family protein [Methylobacterium sp.]MCA3638353.1 nucleotidyltransferase family protein [Methylobacterium sp.]